MLWRMGLGLEAARYVPPAPSSEGSLLRLTPRGLGCERRLGAIVVAIKTRQHQHGCQHLGGHERGCLTVGWPQSRAVASLPRIRRRVTRHITATCQAGEVGGGKFLGGSLQLRMDAGLTVPSSMATRCNVGNDEEEGRCDTASITTHCLAWRRQRPVKCSRTARWASAVVSRSGRGGGEARRLAQRQRCAKNGKRKSSAGRPSNLQVAAGATSTQCLRRASGPCVLLAGS